MKIIQSASSMYSSLKGRLIGRVPGDNLLFVFHHLETCLDMNKKGHFMHVNEINLSPPTRFVRVHCDKCGYKETLEMTHAKYDFPGCQEHKMDEALS